MLVGQGMTKGYLPYRDFYDLKGPLLFFIEYIGQLISYGRTGIFIVQFINLFLTLTIVTKIFRHYGINNRFTEFVLLLPLLYVACYTFQQGNLTEEYSLPLLMSCLYLGLLFWEKKDITDTSHSKRFFLYCGAWFGLCFGLLTMIRITNGAIICSMAFVISMYLIDNRKFRELGICALSFVACMIASWIPFLLFYGIHGLIGEMMEAYFVLGFRYSSEQSISQHVVEAVLRNNNNLICLIIIPSVVPVILRWKTVWVRFFVIFCSIATFFATSSGNNYLHYYTLTIPLIVILEVSIVDSGSKKIRIREIVAVLIAFIVTMTIDRFHEAAKWKLFILIGLLIAYKCVLRFVFTYEAPKCDNALYFGIIILVILLILPRCSREDFLRGCAITMVLTLSLAPFYYWTSQGTSCITFLVNKGESFNWLIQSGGKEVLELVPQDDIYRYDTLSSRLKNSSMLTQRSGYDEYNSIYNNDIDHLMADLGVNSSASSSIINGVDTRSDLEALFGTRFIIRDNNETETSPMPYGYSVHSADFSSTSGNIYDLYTTPYDTSLVLYRKDVMNESDYDALSCYDKQQALINAIILKDEATTFDYTEETSIPYTISAGENVTINGDQITTTSDNCYIDLILDKQYDGVGEWYLSLKNIKNNDKDTKSFTVSASAGANEDTEAHTYYFWRQVSPSTDRHHMYGGKDSWLLKSKFEYEVVDKIRITFNNAGNYTLEEISVFFESEEKIASNVLGLSHPDTGLYKNGNTLSTSVNMGEDGYALIMVPYSDGWTATVDGQDAEIIRADRAFMAFKLSRGQHDITLKYRTPYLTVGLAGAAMITISLVAVEIIRYRMNKKSKTDKRSATK